MTIHSKFKLNGNEITIDNIIKVSEKLRISGIEHKVSVAKFLIEWISDSDTIKVNTSGSTGTPKTIKLLKQHMINSAMATGKFFDLKEGTTALLCLSADYIAGKMMLVRAMVLGWDLYCVAPSSTPLQYTNKVFDFTAMVPLQVERSLNELQRVAKIIIGGAPISNDLLEKINLVPSMCYATYGMTETITHIAVKKLNFSNRSEVFEVLPNVNVSLDARGCLVIEAPLVSKEIVVTNDIVTITATNHFKWIGRFDNIINSGGVKLFPEQIERKISKVIKERFFVIGMSAKLLGQKLVLVIENEDFKQNYNELIDTLTLSRYERPKVIYTVSNFIETATGKVNRKATLNSFKLI